VRPTVATLLVSAALTFSPPADAAPHSPRCHFTCADQCEWERCYDRCMQRCLNEPSRRSRGRRVPPGERNPQEPLVDLVLRVLVELLDAGIVMTGGALGFLASILRASKRRHKLRKAMECEREANTHDRKAADLRAEADRLKHDL
jgi:hypothetical protein